MEISVKIEDNSQDLPAPASELSEQAAAGILETHHFAKKRSFVLLGCIIKTSL